MAIAVEELEVGKVKPAPWNPRNKIDPKAPNTLDMVAAIKAKGILSPILVRPNGKTWQIVYGERRWTCAKLAGLATVPAIVRALDVETAQEMTFIENFNREDLTPLEEARGVKSLMDGGSNVAEVAAKIGHTVNWVVRRAALVDLSKVWQDQLAKPDQGKLLGWGIAHLELVARLPEVAQDECYSEFIEDYWQEGAPQIKDLKRWIDASTFYLAKAPWDLADGAIGDPKAGACVDCTKRSSCQPGLFDDYDASEKTLKKNDRCLDATCWEQKNEHGLKVKLAEMQEKHEGLVLVGGGGRAFGKKTIGEWEVKRVKKSTKGAVPCVTVGYNKVGSVFYAKRTSTQSSTGEKKRMPGTATPLKDRRAALKKRRDLLVGKEVKEKLEASGIPKGMGMADLLRMVSVFGISGCEMRYQVKATWDKANDKKKDWAQISKDAWGQLREILSGRMNGCILYYREKEYQIELTNMATLAGLQLPAMRKKAAEEIPEPKSWANLNADGTPKAAPAAKKKKAKTAPAAKKKKAKKTAPAKKKKAKKSELQEVTKYGNLSDVDTPRGGTAMCVMCGDEATAICKDCKRDVCDMCGRFDDLQCSDCYDKD